MINRLITEMSVGATKATQRSTNEFPPALFQDEVTETEDINPVTGMI
ncbi:hypothetical protein [Roseiconus lacunae]|nr:hypothetical protein [Roseiconus lacunae]